LHSCNVKTQICVTRPQCVKKSLTKTGRCAAALSRRRNQLLLVLHFSERFLMTASLRGRRMPNYIYLFIHCFTHRGNALAVTKETVNYTYECRGHLKPLRVIIYIGNKFILCFYTFWLLWITFISLIFWINCLIFCFQSLFLCLHIFPFRVSLMLFLLYIVYRKVAALYHWTLTGMLSVWTT
jgi:hypothetical protein